MKKTVCITGSTSGIGLATAKAYAALGYNIIFNGLETNGEEIAATVAQEFGIQYHFSNADITNAEQRNAMIHAAYEKFGSIEILVNNAGIQFVSEVENFPDEKWQKIIEVNLNAAFHLTKAVFGKMKEKKYGRIVNVASAHGLIASPFKSAYISSKFGIIGFTKTLSLEGGEFGITANAVCPGYVMTPIVEKQIPEQMKVHQMTEEEVIKKVFLKEHAVKSFITIEAIAASILFLTESEASPFITGIALPIDAGWTAH